MLSPTVAMFARYALAVGISFAVAKGWLTPEAADSTTKLLLELLGVLASFTPAVYAAVKIDNGPKWPNF